MWAPCVLPLFGVACWAHTVAHKVVSGAAIAAMYISPHHRPCIDHAQKCYWHMRMICAAIQIPARTHGHTLLRLTDSELEETPLSTHHTRLFSCLFILYVSRPRGETVWVLRFCVLSSARTIFCKQKRKAVYNDIYLCQDRGKVQSKREMEGKRQERKSQHVLQQGGLPLLPYRPHCPLNL